MARGQRDTHHTSPAFQQNANHINPFRLSPFWGLCANFQTPRCLSSKVGRHKPPGPEAEQSEYKSRLAQLDFTEMQAVHMLSSFASRERSFPMESVQPWLQLLQDLQVQHPTQVVARHSIILASRAATARANASGVVVWLQSLGATQGEIAVLLMKRAMILNVPHATAAAVTAWLRKNLGWSTSTIFIGLKKYPELFGLSCKNLEATRAWFTSEGFSITVFEQQPQLLQCNLSSISNQAKARFLTQVIRQDIQQLLTCSSYLKYSLLGRIGPRSAFHSLHCKGQPFSLSYRLKPNDADFAEQLTSSSLDAECNSRGMKRSHVYAEFKTSWQQREGQEWDVGKKKQSMGLKKE